jgi:hypothetical protein
MEAATKIVLGCITILLLASHLRSQCPNSPSDIYEIDQNYRNGDFEEILSKGHCLEELFESTQPIHEPSNDLLSATERFMHYYALSCLEMGRDSEAIAATELLMERFPHHVLNPEKDPLEFARVLDSIVPYPVHQFGLVCGPTITIVAMHAPISFRTDLPAGLDSIRTLSLHPGDSGFKHIEQRTRVDMGFQWIRSLSYNASVTMGIGWEAMGYSRYYNAPQNAPSKWQVELHEKFDFLRIPFFYQYRFTGKLKSARKAHTDLLIHTGIYARVLLYSRATLVATTFQGGSLLQTTTNVLNGPPPRREVFAMGGTFGLGYHLDFREFSIYMRFSANLEFTRQYSQNEKYPEEYQHLLWEYHIADQYMKLNSVQFTVGFFLPHRYRIKNFKRA